MPSLSTFFSTLIQMFSDFFYVTQILFLLMNLKWIFRLLRAIDGRECLFVDSAVRFDFLYWFLFVWIHFLFGLITDTSKQNADNNNKSQQFVNLNLNSQHSCFSVIPLENSRIRMNREQNLIHHYRYDLIIVRIRLYAYVCASSSSS